MAPRLIVSGGQSGADRGGLDAAIALGIPHGGYCPKGRRAEDGKIPSCYQLVETSSRGYPERTLKNVVQSDATVIFQIMPSAGCNLTRRYCEQTNRAFLVLDHRDQEAAAARLLSWLDERPVRTLNVAGHRESSVPGIQSGVKDTLVRAFGALCKFCGNTPRDICPTCPRGQACVP